MSAPPAARPPLAVPVERSIPATWRWGAIAFALAFPTFYTWLYFDLFAGQPAMRWAYGIGKTIQFLFPVVWVLGVERRWSAWGAAGARPVANSGKPLMSTARSVLVGASFGAAVFVAGWALYRGGLRGTSMLADAPAMISAKLTDIGFATPGAFLVLALFYSLLHSSAEEYYWRWFTFGFLRQHAPLPAAMAISSLGFMAHHVLVVAKFVQPWPLALALSLCIAIGGAFWAWLYQRSGTLWGAWISHLLIDAVLMLIGYDLMWGVG